ncbi:hypothetical protein [Capnocytophaga sp.]|uniref:hypothetical protein n=1 Tax=Capnocytophaga sp. TaxID=44737 RepID=UPI0026DB552E|nr:hypothetical protein [Capnocytophaga sp.]MDO5104254.1 hypothetical protein [Capnocytophaga sp.]
MKKILLIAVLIGFLQSCTVNMDVTFHKDQTTSFLIELDVKESEGASELLKTMPDSSNQKLPKDWKTLYQLAEEEGKPIHKDSVELAKKIAVKGLFVGDTPSGFAFKIDRLSNQELDEIEKSDNKEHKIISPFVNSADDWDGKRLVLDMEELFKTGYETDKTDKKTQNEAESSGELEDKIQDFAQMLEMQINFTFRFENKIKSIKGKHENFKKIDDHTVQVRRELNEETKKSKTNDKKIIITTE